MIAISSRDTIAGCRNRMTQQVFAVLGASAGKLRVVDPRGRVVSLGESLFDEEAEFGPEAFTANQLGVLGCVATAREKDSVREERARRMLAGLQIVISGSDFAQFCEALANAISRLTARGHRTNGSDPWLGHRVSFDANLHPFVGASFSHNDDPEEREYLEDSPLTDLIRARLRQVPLAGPPGGRVFISRRGVFRKRTHDGSPELLISWGVEEEAA